MIGMQNMELYGNIFCVILAECDN